METIRWVGLDLGTTTGYCYHDLNSEDEIVLSGVGEIVMTKLPMPERWVKFYRAVRSIFKPRTVVCYEQVHHHAGVRAAHVYGAYLGLMEMAAHESIEERPLRFIPVSPTQLKKFATGKGTASKLHMIDSAHTYLPDLAGSCGIRTHNEADAAWIAQFGLQKGQPTHLNT